MRKGYLMGMYGSFLCTIILFSTACNSNQSSAPAEDSFTTKTDTPMKAAPSPLHATGSNLYFLYVDASVFTNLNNPPSKKMTFRFFMQSPDSLTLSSWSSVSNSPRFPDPSSLTLSIASPSGLEYGTGNYFGNLVLYNDQIIKLIQQINTDHATKVLFVPINPATTGGQISYYVIPTSIAPLTLKYSDFEKFFLTAEQTNPSPPKSSF